MRLTDDLRAVFERWAIDPNDPDELQYWGNAGSKGEIHTVLTDIEIEEFMGSDDELHRYLAEVDSQTRADADMLWRWVQDDCATEPVDPPLSRVWDGEAYREL